MQAPIFTSQLDGSLVGLGSAVREERAHPLALNAELFRELNLAHIVIQVGDVDELSYLALHRLDNGWMAVPQHVDGNARHKVKILFAIAIPDARTRTSDERYRLALERSL